MKKIMMVALVTLMSFSAFSAAPEHFYECGGIDDVEENRVGVNLKSEKAGYFDNDSTSYMKLADIVSLQTDPAQEQYIFKGYSDNYGALELRFNLTYRFATLFVTDDQGKTSVIGSAECNNAYPWSDLK